MWRVSREARAFGFGVDGRSRARAGRREQPIAWIGGTAALILFVALLVPYKTTVDEVHVVLPLLLLILVASSFGGERLGFFLAALGFVVIDYFFQPPYAVFRLNKPHDVTVLVSFFVTAAVATRLLTRAQREAEEAQRRTEEVQWMADLGSRMLSARSPVDALERVATATCEVLHAAECAIIRGRSGEDGELVVRVTTGRGAGSGGARSEAAGRAHTSAHLPLQGPLHFPLQADGVVIGDMRVDGVDPTALRATRATTLQALAQYAALGVDRMRLAADAAHADALRQADRMKDMVLASVSHDLRTPLTTIKLLAASLVRRGESGAAQIEEEADRLSRMVGDLLDLSRARAGELSLATDVNTLEDLVGAAMRQLAPLLGDRRVHREVADHEGPLVGKFDFVASMRVLVNLLENAAKYSPASAPIDLVARRSGGDLVVEVRDRGEGVKEDDRDRIFAPFYRSKYRLADVGGAGLGLAVARMLAEAQGGKLTHAPREGGGSVFTFTLPALDQSFEPVFEEGEQGAA